MGNKSWLNRQRKQELIDLGQYAGYLLYARDQTLCSGSKLTSLSTEAETHTKPDVVEALDTFLQNNEARFSDDDRFDGYYLSRKTPRKSAPDASDSGEALRSVVRGRGRKSTMPKVKSEPE